MSRKKGLHYNLWKETGYYFSTKAINIWVIDLSQDIGSELTMWETIRKQFNKTL